MKLKWPSFIYFGLLLHLCSSVSTKSYFEQSSLNPHGSEFTLREDYVNALPDSNGDVFTSNSDFEFVDQPLTTLNIVDPLGKNIQSKSLDKQNNDMKEYLKGETTQTKDNKATNNSKNGKNLPSQLLENGKTTSKSKKSSSPSKDSPVLLTQDYEIEEVYWKDQNTRVRVMKPVYRSLSDPISIAFFLVLAIILIGVIVLVRETINRWMEKNFGASLDAILKDIITLYLIITILRILDYFDVFMNLEYYVNLRLVSVSFLVFSIFWLIMGIYSVLRCHSYVKGWNNLEKLFPKREQIFRQYENLYLESSRDRGQTQELEEKKEQLEYFLIRQEFVFPTFLPILSEAFLRDDFNFATYLAKSLAKASDSMFKYSFVSLLTVVFVGGLWFLFTGLELETQIYIINCLPFLVFLTLWMMQRKLGYIYKMLIQNVTSPYDINFTKFDNLRQPLVNLDKLKVPEYLNGKDGSKSRSKPFFGFKLPNRHEELFWLDSPRFMVRLMHITLILQIFWLAALALNFASQLDDVKQYIFVGVGSMLCLLNLLYFIPENLKIFCLTNSIQMLKDKKLITEVIDENKKRNIEIFTKLFRLLKSRSREQKLAEAKPTSVREVIIEQVRNHFQSLPKDDDDKISLGHLRDLAHYCGADLSDDELIYLGRITTEKDDKISFTSFMEGVERFVDDVRQDKLKVIRETLQSMINRNDGMVSLREFRDAISASNILQTDEIETMMHEIRYLPFQNAEISIDLIARFLRDSIEGMPV